MAEHIAHWFQNVPAEAITLLIAMLPIAELRGAIPWALTNPPIGGGLTWQTAYVYSVIGNFIPVIPILLLLEPVSNWLRRFRVFDRFFNWLFERTRRRGKMIEKYKAVGLILFVGIPLPVTGAWTGSVAAFLFGVRTRFAIPCIIAGILLAGVVVTLACMGVIGFIGIMKIGA